MPYSTRGSWKGCLRLFPICLSITVILPHLPLFASEVVKLEASLNTVQITQDRRGAWSQGDSVCIMKGETKVGCGIVSKANHKRATVDLKERIVGQRVAIGDRVVPTDNQDRRLAAFTPSVEYTTTENRFSKGQVSVELLGAAVLYSVFGSYRPIRELAFNAGFSYLSTSASYGSGSTSASASGKVLQFPISISYLLGGSNNFLEMLGGANLMFGSANVSASNTSSDASSTLLLPQLGVGWRYWPALGGFHFRLTAYGNLVPSHGFFPWVGIGLGYAL